LERHIFLTGGTGLVGGHLLPKLALADPKAQITLLIRAASEKEAQARLRAIWQEWASSNEARIMPDRIRALRGDVTLPQLGLGGPAFKDLTVSVTHILHAAATVKFNLPLEEARMINCHGTQQVIDLAHQAIRAKLQHVACLSTAYVCGNRTGLIREEDLDCGQRFRNTYEQAKFESEIFLRAHQSNLPLTIVRPSIIVGDSQTGKTTSFNVLYYPLKLFYQGLLPVIPGDPTTRLDVVSVDYVADAICHILLSPKHSGKTYHLVSGSARSNSTKEIAERAVAYLNRMNSQKFKPPRFISLDVYQSLRPMAPPTVQEVMNKLDFYLPYLAQQHDFADAQTQKALAGTKIAAQPLLNYLEKTLAYCIATGWGELR
jgi:thioester reductase-like protein